MTMLGLFSMVVPPVTGSDKNLGHFVGLGGRVWVGVMSGYECSILLQGEDPMSGGSDM